MTTTLAVVGGLELEAIESLEPPRQIPGGSIAPNTERYIWPVHLDVFPPEMILKQADNDLKLDPEEG